jgi:hypothetical protein
VLKSTSHEIAICSPRNLRAHLPRQEQEFFNARWHLRCDSDSCRTRLSPMESSICTPMRIFPCRNTRNTRKYLRPLHGQGRGLTTLQIKEGIKANYTLRSKGTSGGEGPRTHVQGKHLKQLLNQLTDLSSPRQQFDGLCPLRPPREPTTKTRSRIRRS